MTTSATAPLVRRRRRILAHRAPLIAACVALVLTRADGRGVWPMTLVGALVLSEALLTLTPPSRFGDHRFDRILGTLDLILVALATASTAPGHPWSLTVSCFLTIVLVSMASDRWHACAGTGAAGAMHAWILASGAAAMPPGAALALELSVILGVGLHYGCLAARARDRRRRAAFAQHEDAGLSMLQSILDAIAQAPDLATLASTLVGRIGAVVPAVRCSLLCFDEARRRCWVLASHDAPDLPLVEIDLNHYPEVRRAIVTRDPVLIQDAFSDPLTRAVRARLESLDFRSMLVIPIECRGRLQGLLFIRASAAHGSFGRRDINLCSTVARAVAHPLAAALEALERSEDEGRSRGSARQHDGGPVQAAG